jgi:hypothetical protein
VEQPRVIGPYQAGFWALALARRLARSLAMLEQALLSAAWAGRPSARRPIHARSIWVIRSGAITADGMNITGAAVVDRNCAGREAREENAGFLFFGLFG